MKNKKLILAKTHDRCVSGQPKLVVVMIHGIASDSSTFNRALEYLESEQKLKDVRFVTFDLLGSGKSLKDDELEYNYDEQVAALHQAIQDLKFGEIPLVLAGHSLGTFIVTRYASKYPEETARLILLSPPIYTEEDFENPAFQLGIDAFKKVVSVKNPDILKEKAFNNSMKNIVLDRQNYNVLTDVKVPTTLIYGNDDQIIAPYNIPRLVKKCKQIKAIRTLGRHGVSRDKYSKIPVILEELLEDDKKTS